MTIQEFAQLCGVTATTVSRVFTSPEKVKEITRKRILQIAEEQGYRPNRAASAAFNGKTRMIGVMMMSEGNSYFACIANGIQDELFRNEYTPVLLNMHWQDSLTVIRRLIDFRVAGIIMVDPRRGLFPEEQREVERLDIPYMFFDDAPRKNFPHDWVSTDDESGGTLLANHLLKLGHRDIGVISSPFCTARVDAFCRTARKADARLRVFPREIFSELFRNPADLPTAVFACTDDLAFACQNIILSMGLSIPGDISLAGYADLDFAQYVHPGLTTVRQNGNAVGKCAAQLMLNRLKNPSLPIRHELLPVELIVRNSTGAPKTKKNR